MFALKQLRKYNPPELAVVMVNDESRKEAIPLSTDDAAVTAPYVIDPDPREYSDPREPSGGTGTRVCYTREAGNIAHFHVVIRAICIYRLVDLKHQL